MNGPELTFEAADASRFVDASELSGSSTLTPMDEQGRDLAWSVRSGRPLPGASLVDGEWVVSWSTCAVMRIVNVTPDSFSDGGVHADATVDISGLRDPEMVAVCASLRVPVVIMHMQGEPATMQADPRYDDVVSEVAAFLEERSHAALDAGVPSVLVDPGIGFGKTLEQNLALLSAFPYRAVAHPVLVGASRKWLVGRLANVAHAVDRDPGSIAVHLDAAQRGAAMVPGA